jgi:hypothetical protein
MQQRKENAIMGREIRRVPVDWHHPYRKDLTGRDTDQYQPLYDEDSETAWTDWLEGFEQWKAGELQETIKEHPMTPAFATKAELIDYLSTKGTYWDNGEPWPREAAEGFVEQEWAPSMIAMVSDKGAQIVMPNDPAMYAK